MLVCHTARRERRVARSNSPPREDVHARPVCEVVAPQQTADGDPLRGERDRVTEPAKPDGAAVRVPSCLLPVLAVAFVAERRPVDARVGGR